MPEKQRKDNRHERSRSPGRLSPRFVFGSFAVNPSRSRCARRAATFPPKYPAPTSKLTHANPTSLPPAVSFGAELSRELVALVCSSAPPPQSRLATTDAVLEGAVLVFHEQSKNVGARPL